MSSAQTINANNGIFFPKDYIFFVKPTEYDMSYRKLENYKKLAEIQRWGRNNPTKFMERFFGVELLDVQTYIFMNTWTRQYSLWVESRNAGKTTMLALYYMAKTMLFNNFKSYICAGTSDQSIEAFKKIEDIAFKRLDSFVDLTDVFANETVKNQSGSTGFLHTPSGWNYSLYNGSSVTTLNSNVDAKRETFPRLFSNE